MDVSRLFATEVCTVSLCDAKGFEDLNDDLARMSSALSVDDEAGIRWCAENGYDGYTSYSSLDDLTRRATCFRDLGRHVLRHAGDFATYLEMDTAGRRFVLDSMWVNVLRPGGRHPSHIHPQSVLSGTYYVAVPRASAAIRFEDPRLGMMMAAPAPLSGCRLERQRFVNLIPKVGDLLLWESWLRHEVPVHRARGVRISVSFNLRLS
jgi:uncharacterized protein (TIGR02466 family)